MLSFTAATAMGLYRAAVGIQAPRGARQALAFNIPTADTNIAANDYLLAYQLIEGLRVADFCWGTPQAKQAILRFAVRAGLAGTYCAGVKLGTGGTRSWIGEYTISAAEVNTFVERFFVIPGDTVGTWPVDNTACVQIFFVFASGSAYHGVKGWNDGNKIATAAISNGMGAVCAHFVTEVGLYLDPDNTGLPPQWQMPDEAEELAACQRYYQRHFDIVIGGSSSTIAGQWYTAPLPCAMRINPAFSTSGTVTNVNYTGPNGNIVNPGQLRFSGINVAAGGFSSSFNAVLNARM